LADDDDGVDGGKGIRMLPTMEELREYIDLDNNSWISLRLLVELPGFECSMGDGGRFNGCVVGGLSFAFFFKVMAQIWVIFNSLVLYHKISSYYETNQIIDHK